MSWGDILKDGVWNKLERQRYGFGEITLFDIGLMLKAMESTGKWQEELAEMREGLAKIESVLSNLRESL